MRTEKLYLLNPYQISFDATVLQCTPREGGGFAVVLDRTCFYPESGGQLSDRGEAGDARVEHVVEDSGGAVIHEISKELAQGEVTCRIDWPIRFDHMQQHTGQHILSRAFLEICDAETVSFHMGEEDCTIDLDKGSLEDSILRRAEEMSNSVIHSNRNVATINVSYKEVESYKLRKPVPPGIEEVRLVMVEDFDASACCGTHVAGTGELGVIKIIKAEKVRDKTRVHFKVGLRAYRDYSDKHDIVVSLARRFTTSPQGLEGKVDKLIDENRELRNLLKKKNKKLIAVEKTELLGKAEVYRGKRFVMGVIEGSDRDYLRQLSSAFKDDEGVIVLLASEKGDAVINSSSDLKGDFAGCLVDAAKRFGGTGGGKGGFASVSIPASADAGLFLREVYENVKKSV